MSVSGLDIHRQAQRFVVGAWALVLLGAAVLILGYGSIPDVVVLFRPPWAAAPTLGPKSLITVGRILSMGAAQVGVATVMVVSSRGTAAWGRFWRWLALVAGTKTLLECVGFVLSPGGILERAVALGTIAIVVCFLAAAASWWSRGELRAHPHLDRSQRAWCIASLALWFVSVLAPRFAT